MEVFFNMIVTFCLGYIIGQIQSLLKILRQIRDKNGKT